MVGGTVGAALPAFTTFPPADDPFWTELVFADDDDEDDEDDDDDAPDEEEADALEAPGMLAKLYIVFYGRLPDTEGFTFWHDFLASDPEIDLQVLADFFVAAAEFDTLYENSPAEAVVQAMFVNGLQRSATEEDEAFWGEALSGENGFGLTDFALAFLLAEETDAAHGDEIRAFIEEMGLADSEDVDDEDEDDEDIVFLEATEGADSFQFPEGEGIAVVEGFDPAIDVVDASGRAASREEVGIYEEGDGLFLMLDDSELFLADVEIPASDLQILF